MTPEPEWVDLGLPSGLLWAKTNIGATVPESSGLYFSWGNTDGHPAGSGYDFSQDTYNSTPGAAINEDIPLSQDAARASLGVPWRMPSSDEFQELVENCTSEWTTLNSVYGLLFTSSINGRTLFFPAAGGYNGTSLVNQGSHGYYWATSYLTVSDAYFMSFNSADVNPRNYYTRRDGFTIRAVRPGATQSDLHAQPVVLSPSMGDHGTTEVPVKTSSEPGDNVYTKKKKGGK